jgi:hypothetical protein
MIKAVQAGAHALDMMLCGARDESGSSDFLPQHFRSKDCICKGFKTHLGTCPMC